jgi:hypothetical protein
MGLFSILLILFLIGSLFRACASDDVDFWAITRVVYTDEVIASDAPDACLRFSDLPASVSTTEGEVLASGHDWSVDPEITTPALGCELMLELEDLPRFDRYVVTVEGEGSHTYSLESIEENFGLVEWDPVCLNEAHPCTAFRAQPPYAS